MVTKTSGSSSVAFSIMLAPSYGTAQALFRAGFTNIDDEVEQATPLMTLRKPGFYMLNEASLQHSTVSLNSSLRMAAAWIGRLLLIRLAPEYSGGVAATAPIRSLTWLRIPPGLGRYILILLARALSRA